MDYATLAHAVEQDAALRRKQILQPVGGRNDKIFPPTYPEERRGQGPRHVFERRRLNGREAWCVLVDSVQSQANRLEEALLSAVREGAITVPYVTVDFGKAGLAGITEITSLEAPHRVYDAILRDSLLDGQPFMKGELGIRLAEAKPGDATALLETSPTALLLGAWHSTGEGGGLGAKFPRCLVSEIIAMDVPVEDGPADPRTGEVEVRTCPFRKLYPDIMVVQPAQNWDSDNGAGPLDCPTCGRVFAKRPVRADLIVIGRIRRKNLPQMRLAEDQHPVQALAAHCADQTLYIRILPRRSRRDRSVADTYRPHPRGEDKPDGIFGKDSEAVEDAALAQATMPRGLYCATRLPRSPFSAATAFAGTCSDHGRSVRARLSATGSQFLMDFLFLPNKALR